MRRYFIIVAIGAISLSALFSCTKDSTLDDYDSQNYVKSVRFTVDEMISDEMATRTILNGTSFIWAATDTVGIYPDKGSQIFFAMTNGAGTNSAIFDGGGWAFRAGATYYSYYPFIPDFYLDRSRIPVHFDGQVQDGPNNFSHFGKYDYLYTDPTTEREGTISFAYHHLICVMKFKATLPAGTYKQLTVTAPDAVFVKKGHFDLMADSPSVIGDEFTKELSVGLNNVTVNGTEQIEIYLVSAPFDLTGKNMTISVINSEKKQFDFVKPITKEYVSFKIYNITCDSWTERIPLVSVAGVSLNRSAISLKVGESKILEASIIPENASNKEIEWTIDDPSVASVNSIGEVTAKKDGTAYVTVSSIDGGHNATCKVSVNSDGNNENPDIGSEWQW